MPKQFKEKNQENNSDNFIWTDDLAWEYHHFCNEQCRDIKNILGGGRFFEKFKELKLKEKKNVNTFK